MSAPDQNWRVAHAGERTAADELGDVLAYLARRKANAAVMVARSPDFEDKARWIVRQLGVMEDELRHGLHEGEAQMANPDPAG